MNQCKKLFPKTHRPDKHSIMITHSFTYMIESTNVNKEVLHFKIQKAAMLNEECPVSVSYLEIL